MKNQIFLANFYSSACLDAYCQSFFGENRVGKNGFCLVEQHRLVDIARGEMPDNQPFHFCVTGNGSRIGGNRVESLLGALPQVREESRFVVEQVVKEIQE